LRNIQFGLKRRQLRNYVKPFAREHRVTASDNNRSEFRSNVFLAAALEANSNVHAVRIRNLSKSGALVEGVDLPHAGAYILLRRGRLQIEGDLAWENAGHAGLNFRSPIKIADWIRRIGHEGQQGIDRIVQTIKTSNEPSAADLHPLRKKSIVEISAELEAICERLAGLPPRSIEFDEELLKLDALAQSLKRLAGGGTF